jgi:hypothetical protein
MNFSSNLLGNFQDETLADKAPAWVCLVLGFHGLLIPTYRVFCYLLTAKDPLAPPTFSILALADGPVSAGQPAIADAQPEGDGEDAAELGDHLPAEGGAAPAPGPEAGANKKKDEEREQSRFRVSVLGYHRCTGPALFFTKVYVYLKWALKHVKLMRRVLLLAGDVYEAGEQAKERKRREVLHRGGSAGELESLPRRSYRLLEKYDCGMETEFRASTKKFMDDDEEYGRIPPAGRTRRVEMEIVQSAVRGWAHI